MNANDLRRCFSRRGYTQARVQKALGIKSQTTMSRKMRDGSFTLPEVRDLVRVLGIEPDEIYGIFFTDE